MNRWKIASLLFGSGFCALVYQTAWLREFRLIFGASTAASAAVLAIFMGGIGLGGLLLGRRADRVRNPLAMYAQLEIGVSIFAAITPFLILAVRWIYVLVGGTQTLGPVFGTVGRLILASVVLAVPTILMGGTLPAAARAAETNEDLSRRHLALLYGLNTGGAVVGALVSTFLLLEALGNRHTLWVAVGLNLIVAITARALSRQLPELSSKDMEEDSKPVSVPTSELESDEPLVSPRFVLAAASIVGFAFFLMEIVWYRMLGPLLGGSTFTFGLILAVALLGIGLGGAAYSFLISNRPVSLNDFALTAAFEALCISVPFMLGDKIAVFSLLLRDLSAVGFHGHIASWAIVTSIVVLPTAFVAGIQFPILIALLGRGRKGVGRHVGLAYLWNTLGAIVGALAGGFGILPLLGALGTWKLVASLLAALAIVSGLLHTRRGSLTVVLGPALISVLAVIMLLGTGPTAAWRHSGVGAGRSGGYDATRNGVRYWASNFRRAIRWEAEGVESSVALSAWSAWAFVINGKTDGNARGDAGTQVMAGLVGAILHPEPKTSLVVGLGTGSSAGWLGVVPTMERVDVVELEPALEEVARLCAPVNQNVLANPKVHLHIGDAREWILTTRQKYDVIFSEPSNPFRAGIASLFTQEFYESAQDALEDDGLFLQWLQVYEVDSDTVKTVLATLGSVFQHVETWQTTTGDLLLVASKQPIDYDVARLERVIASEPYRSALYNAWGTDDIEGFLAHYVAGENVTRAVTASNHEINTDDRTPIEFGFARNVGTHSQFQIAELRSFARTLHAQTPDLKNGSVNGELVEDRMVTIATIERQTTPPLPFFDEEQSQRAAAHTAWVNGDFPQVVAQWRSQSREPRGPVELRILADALADAGNVDALGYVESIRTRQPIEAQMIEARYLYRIGKFEEAAETLSLAFEAYRNDPWPDRLLTQRALALAGTMAKTNPDRRIAARVFDAISQPFSVMMHEEARLSALLNLGMNMDSRARCNDRLRSVFEVLEPNVPWNRTVLLRRAQCYVEWGHPRAGLASDELAEYLANEPVPFLFGLEVPSVNSRIEPEAGMPVQAQ